ncbi:MAG: Nif3-like dinuclear metal center hexameric protein [Pirellulaceae bacterium]
MTTVGQIRDALLHIAPEHLAESWDNVGLLAGDPNDIVECAMTCLTVTKQTVDEAIAKSVDLLITHHPIPFRPISSITTESPTGDLMWNLAKNGISVYSPHTAWDSAANGINQQIANGIGLTNTAPIIVNEKDENQLGAGRYGDWEGKLSHLAKVLCTFLHIDSLQSVGNLDNQIARVGVACGSAGEFIQDAKEAGCDVLITGETRFHTCLEAEALGISLLLPGHYASERFASESLAVMIQDLFKDLSCFASENECDPLHWYLP